MPSTEIDPRAMDAQAFARLIKRTPAGELDRVLHGDRRRAVLDELVRRMPSAFRADRGAAINAVVHWRVGDRPDGGADCYEFVIAAGRCELSSEPAHPPTLTLSLGAVDFVHLVTGNAQAVLLVMKGRLRARGDLAQTAKLPHLFEVPRPG